MSEPNLPKFDAYAGEYERLHKSSIAASGEDPDYFHAYKIRCLARKRAEGPVLDFGCGIGNLTVRLVNGHGAVHGYDPSSESIAAAKERVPTATFHTTLDTIPRGHFGTAVLSGVLHHVPPAERTPLLAKVHEMLRPGGRVFVFEHNPLNPLTRRAVKMCEFDDDAILLYPWEARRLLKKCGFTSVELDYIVFFPRQLSALRPLEPRLRRVVLGAQQMLIGHRT